MQHQNDLKSDPGEALEGTGRRDGVAWLGAACAAGAWLWLAPRYVPTGDSGMQIGIAALALGLILLFVGGARQGRAGLGLMVGLAAGLGLLALDTLLARFEAAAQPSVQPFAWVGWAMARSVGELASVEGSRLLMHDPQGAVTFTPTWSLTAFRSLLAFWFVGLLLLGARDGRDFGGGLMRLVLVPLVFFMLRFGTLVLVYASSDDVLASKSNASIAMFWQPESVMGTLLLSAIALSYLEKPVAWRLPGGGALVQRAAATAAAAGLFLGASYAWQDPGTPKQGRVLVDDRLTGIWEPAGRLLDTERYGDFSAYSLAAMVENLARHFSVTVNATEEYNREYLDQFDVFILKTPEHALSETEINAIQSWVLAGGGLFAISDHTDLMGMSTNLNQVVRRFGIEFQFDATANVQHGGFDYWYDPALPEHPISAGLTPFELMTPCSTRISKGARAVMTVEHSMATGGDYSGGSHFGTLGPDPSRPHGRLVLAAAAEWDAGRVASFSDSTVLSSFAYYTWSHAEYILRTVSWLNRKNSAWYWLRWVFGGIGGILVLVWLRRLGDSDENGAAMPGGLVTGMLFFAGALSIGAYATSQVAAGALEVVDPVEQNVRVGFVQEGGHAWLPAVLGSQPDTPDHGNLMTFIQTPQRLGCETRVIARDPALLDDIDVLVLLNPDVESGQPEAPAGWVEAVHEWVNAGGKMVVLQRTSHIGHEHIRAPLYLDESLAWEQLPQPMETMSLRRANQGAGVVVHVLGSEEFALQAMGHCMAYPGRSERARYQVAYWLFGELLGINLPERRAYMPNG